MENGKQVYCERCGAPILTKIVDFRQKTKFEEENLNFKMEFNKNLQKIKDALAHLNYHIIGYNHTNEQRARLKPWFYPYPIDRKQGLPSEVSEFLAEYKARYLIAAQKRYKFLSNWVVDTFCAVKADELSISEASMIMKQFRDEWKQILKDKFFPKRTVSVVPQMKWFSSNLEDFSFYLTTCLIYESGTSHLSEKPSDIIKKVRKGTKASFSHRVYLIDLLNKRVVKHRGLPKTPSPKPKVIEPMIFND